MNEGGRNNRVLDGETITVFIPMTWKPRGGQKVIIAPDGSDAWVPAKLRPDETLIRALAQAHRWNRMLEQGRFRSITEIAEAEKVDRAYVSRLLDLNLLAPDIQESILEGRQPKGMQLDELTRAMPREWETRTSMQGRLAVRELKSILGLVGASESATSYATLQSNPYGLNCWHLTTCP